MLSLLSLLLAVDCSGPGNALQSAPGNVSGKISCGAIEGGGGAPTDGEYVTYSANASLSAERVLTSGTNTTVDLSVAGQAKVNVSGTVAAATLATTADALTNNPTDCAGGQFATAIAANGNLTCATPAGGADPWTRVATSGSNVTDNTVAGATSLTGLTWSAVAATNYRFRCYLITSAAAATTGVQIGVTGPASPTQLSWTRGSCSSATAKVFTNINAFAVDARTASAGTTRCVEPIEGVLLNGANTAALQWTMNTEIDTSTVTAFIGSWCEYMTF